MTTAEATAPPAARRDARVAGWSYLAVAVTGMVGFLLVRAQLHVPGDAAATAANLVEQEPLARLGLAADLALVVAQAVAALAFLRLFRAVDAVSAAAVAAFGTVNAVVVLVGAAFTATALDLALDGGPPATALLLYDLSAAVWAVGTLFFGLWLVPMGRLVLRSAGMPRPLGWTLVAGGVGYVLSAFLGHLAPGLPVVADVLVVPATVGEFWMIGFLLLRGGPARG